MSYFVVSPSAVTILSRRLSPPGAVFPFPCSILWTNCRDYDKRKAACVPLFPLAGFSLKRLPVRTAIGRFFTRFCFAAIGRFFPPFFLNHGFSRLYFFSVPPFLFVFFAADRLFMRLFKRSRKISPPFFGNSAFSPFLFSFFRFFLACSLFLFPSTLPCLSRLLFSSILLSPLAFSFRKNERSPLPFDARPDRPARSLYAFPFPYQIFRFSI